MRGFSMQYNEGDTFKVNVEIIEDWEEEDNPYRLYITEFDITLDEGFSQEELDEVFDPEYKKLKREERKKELLLELEQIEEAEKFNGRT